LSEMKNIGLGYKQIDIQLVHKTKNERISKRTMPGISEE